jgi:hypothetical protein
MDELKDIHAPYRMSSSAGFDRSPNVTFTLTLGKVYFLCRELTL